MCLQSSEVGRIHLKHAVEVQQTSVSMWQSQEACSIMSSACCRYQNNNGHTTITNNLQILLYFPSCTAGSGTNISEKTPARQWVGGVYFSVMLLTTTGLGDTNPATPAEEILCSIQMVMGLFILGLIISVSQ